jgi:hypothetical protein
VSRGALSGSVIAQTPDAGCALPSEPQGIAAALDADISRGEENMTKTILISVCLAATSLSLNAGAQDERGYSYGPVTEVDYVHVEYGHFDEYMAWVTSTWVPTMEAAKKAGLIIGYKVFQASPKSPDQPNVYLEITYKNMAAYAGDIGDQADAFEAVTEKVICNSTCQNQARVRRNEIRTVLGTEVTREIVFK